MTRYRVGRNVPKKEAGNFVEKVRSGLESEWPDSLVERANRALAVSKSIQGVVGQKLLLSLVSKVIWFLRPDDWTMFDSFAAKGLIGSRYRNLPEVRFLNFYETLDDMDFSGCCSSLRRKILKLAGFNLVPERILDGILLVKGSMPGVNELDLDAAESALGENFSEELKAIGREVRAVLQTNSRWDQFL